MAHADGAAPDAPGPTLVGSHEGIEHALSLAITAVALDRGERVDEAISCYTNVVDALGAARAGLPPQLRDLLDDRVRTYQQRVQLLEMRRVALARRLSLHYSKRYSPFQILTAEEHERVWQAPPPAEYARPFWFLSLVRRSVVSGCLVTPTCFCPREVWEQHGIPLPAVAAKEAAFRAAAGLFDRLPDAEREDLSERFLDVARSIIPDLHNLQLQLRQHVTALPKPPPIHGAARKGRTLDHLSRKLRHWGAHTLAVTKVSAAQVQSYAAAVSHLASKAQGVGIFMERLRTPHVHAPAAASQLPVPRDTISPLYTDLDAIRVSKTAADDAAWSVLDTIALFLQTVVCDVVHKDLEVLMHKYLRRSYKAVRESL